MRISLSILLTHQIPKINLQCTSKVRAFAYHSTVLFLSEFHDYDNQQKNNYYLNPFEYRLSHHTKSIRYFSNVKFSCDKKKKKKRKESGIRLRHRISDLLKQNEITNEELLISNAPIRNTDNTSDHICNNCGIVGKKKNKVYEG